MRHLLITGVPRTGSTFLVALYHNLGFETGFHSYEVKRLMRSKHLTHGGLEIHRLGYTIDDVDLTPVEIVKHPWCSDERPPWRWGAIKHTQFNHKILTVRDYEATVQSQLRRFNIRCYGRGVPKAEEYERQIRRHIPAAQRQLRDWLGEYIEVEFPRSVQDVDYLWQQLEPTVKSKDRFYEAWHETADSEYVTDGN